MVCSKTALDGCFLVCFEFAAWVLLLVCMRGIVAASLCVCWFAYTVDWFCVSSLCLCLSVWLVVYCLLVVVINLVVLISCFWVFDCC